jgi:Putative sensor
VARTSVARAAAAAARAPFSGRARRDIAFCLLTLPLVLPVPVIGFAVTIGLADNAGPPWVAGGNPSWLAMLTAAAVAVLTATLLVATGAARALAAAVRRVAGRLLAEHVPPPPPRHARLGDGPGWRAMAYLMLKLPAGLAECYAVGVFWLAGLVNLTYPFWWLSFRNHSPGVRLNAVPVVTPFDWFGQDHFRVATFPGTFAVFAAGVAMLLAAPWVTRGVLAADRWLIRGLLAASVPVRPTPAIETIAYFCAAELLANAAKHSQANTIKIFITERAGLLALQVTDDGLGGADPSRGSGLSGLAQRVAVVDGRLDIASAPGGPTRITVELPLRAG